MPDHYDVIVLGTGGVGSAALFHLARRGLKVLGLDQFEPAHSHGSSHGETRIIRQAYFEHPDYVPLLLHAYQLWAELEQAVGKQLFYNVGLLQIGPQDGVVIPGVLESARHHNLEVDHLSKQEIEERFPGFRVPSDCVGAFERRAGYLLVEECVLAHLEMAKRLGAEHRCNERVISWDATSDHVAVRTEHQEYHAASLVMAAGPWAPQVMRALKLPLEVRRKDVWWFSTFDDCYRASHGCPTYLFELPQGIFYGFPGLPTSGMKVAEHSGGVTVADPSSVTPEPLGLERVTDFLATCLPGVRPQASRHSLCFYTMTPDEHFVVDRHPEHGNVAFAAGLSGHGFKLTGVLGEVLADLVTRGESSLPVEFLKRDRPALQAAAKNR